MSSSNPVHLPTLTGLRGVAAIVVFVAHFEFSALLPPLAPFLLPFQWQNQAVDLFFVLSGFVLSHVYAEKVARRQMNWRDYSVSRIARIYPLHMTVLLIQLALLFGGSLILNGQAPHSFSIDTGILNLLLLQNWPFLFTHSINSPSWSVSVDCFCYLAVFPLLAHVRLACRPRWLLCGATLLLVCCRLLIQERDGWDDLGRGVLGFVTGWLTHGLFLQDRTEVGGALITRISVFLFAVLFAASACCGLSLDWLVLSMPMLVYGLAKPGGTLLHSFCASRVALFLGDISYSLYMWHGVFAWISKLYIRKQLYASSVWLRSLYLMGEVSVVIVVAAASYRWLEKPAREWLRTRWQSA